MATLFKSKTVNLSLIHPFDVSHTSVKLYIYIYSKMVSFQLVVDSLSIDIYVISISRPLNGASCRHHHFPQCNCGSMDDDEDEDEEENDDHGLVEIIV